MSKSLVATVEGFEHRYRTCYGQVVVTVTSVRHMTLPAFIGGAQIQIGKGSLHHVDIMRVLRLAFIRARIPRAKTRPQAVQARPCRWQLALIAEGHGQLGQLGRRRQVCRLPANGSKRQPLELRLLQRVVGSG